MLCAPTSIVPQQALYIQVITLRTQEMRGGGHKLTPHVTSTFLPTLSRSSHPSTSIFGPINQASIRTKQRQHFTHKGMTAYEYTPLDASKHEIRLLELLPGDSEDIPHCRLTHTSLDHEPQYVALSYAWGDPNNRDTILLDGRPFRVTRNLDIALRNLRGQGLTERLWVDALCINQNDLAERSQQVQLMRMIYQSASSVFAWLGEAADDSDFAMKTIKASGKEDSDIELDPETDPNDIDPRLKVALRKLLDRPYWRRTWIIQELAVPSPRKIWIGCGQFWVPWWDLCDTIMNPFEQSNVKLVTNTHLHRYFTLNANTMFEFQKGPLELIRLLKRSGSYCATDPRDRLYGILGLAKERDQVALVPDYSKPLEQLNAELVEHLIQTEENLNPLHAYRTSRHQTPSWVPQISTGEFPNDSWHRVRPFYASGDSKPHVQFSTNHKTIKIRGLEVDRVSACIGPFESRPELATKLLCTQDFQDAALQAVTRREGYLHDPASENAEIEDRIWRTLVEDGSQFAGPPAPDDFRDMYRVMSERSRTGVKMSSLSSSQAREVVPYLEYSIVKMMHRCFLTTIKGQFGTGPPDVQAGDLLCVLFGGSVVHVLREDGDHHLLVGEAYVHDWMNGEIMRQYQDGEAGLQEKEFELW
ncbi:hypothetical protein FGG08_004606 [Glutinoglossum americanum]|uniref:Heterokaryon incompatibility domain-containing protein n=1 Tax=Glutinoglossum americanum TaxID=1670608 RepID=A0A9P8KWW5_9PEZI|nr:hypothetical protein FGG08_004606 [Glutinoglossum americanum]